jgi:uncharacterized phosphatase
MPKATQVDPSDVLFYIARHGQTVLNADDHYRGATDPDLDKQGRKDAQALADHFDPIKINSILSSSHMRAAETASIIGDHKNLIPHLYDALKSWNIGIVSGLPEEPQAEAMVQHYVKNPNLTIPQGESLNNFRRRVRPFFHQAMQAHAHTGVPPLIVAHHSVIRDAGKVFNGDSNSALVKPGGIVAIHSMFKGGLHVTPVFKPDHTPDVTS